MTISDRLYGQFNITEPVLLKLLNCPTLQRLKGVSQHGYINAFYPGLDFSRFEHSVGVFLLLRKYGAGLEEQIAGLIHDVSHSAFSHCIDYISDSKHDGKQGHQDNVFSAFVRNSEIPEILKEHDIDLERILDDKNFPLKETALPDLCADRIDYSLRLAVSGKRLSEPDLQNILNNLEAKNNLWFFKDLRTATDYAKLFFYLNDNYYAALWAAVMHQSVGDYLRHALSRAYIDKNDLYTTDAEILKKIKVFHKSDRQLAELFTRMNNQVKFKNNPKNYDYLVNLKSRIVDPFFWGEQGLERLSAKQPEWEKIIEREMKIKTYFIKFLP